MKKILIIIAVPVVSMACSDGNMSSMGKQAEKPLIMQIINGSTVPPLPNVEENFKDIGGIDADKNGVRDDVDRLIALNTEQKFRNAAKQAAQLAQSALLNNNQEFLFQYQCALAFLPSDDAVILKNAIFNTKERNDIYNKLDAKAGSVLEVRYSGAGDLFEASKKCQDKNQSVIN